MLSEIDYMIWYHKMFGSSKKGRKALDFYGSYYDLYKAIIEERDESGATVGMPIKKFKDYSPIDANKDIGTCECYGWEVIPCNSPYYPKELLETENYPHILFCDGNKEILTRTVKFAIVGSRVAKSEAEVIARNAAFNLAKTGAVIVSGAALGIDSCAHLGAIEAGGETVGVLGCGLGSSYMDRIGSFYDEVKKSGVYITEMFPFENPTRYTFPQRNRLISGMSKAVLVTCAAEKSGSLITADAAKKQNRRVYAIAPEICFSPGCEELLDKGAYTFYNAGDMAYPFKEFYSKFDDTYCNKPIAIKSGEVQYKDMAIPKKTERKTVKTVGKPKTEEKKEEKIITVPETLSENAKKIYSLLGTEPVLIDSLVNETGLRINHVLIALSELETEGLIKSIAGSRIEKL